MITIDSVLSKNNLREAFEHLSTKGNGAGIDQIPLTDLKDYWSINGERICAEIRNHTYEPGAVIQFEIVGSNGKRRTISKLNTIDRFVTRLIAQKLSLFYEKQFLENSFAYQNNKGTLQAAGYEFVNRFEGKSQKEYSRER